ncbi:MAG: FAD-dependent oxidoreductase [Pyrinomonadaceae bacterium]|nr:FAD-dependent oxidoreductase [Pyrinomonadaceae bacterium]
MKHKCDITIVGSNFGGALTAHVLAKIGYRVCVVDRFEHPRFTIGESTTPLADIAVERIAERYGLKWLKPLARYGTASKISTEVVVGPKRGFSYFHHRQGSAFEPSPERGSELLVAASTSEAVADMHWLRSSVDSFIADRLPDSGVRLLEKYRITEIRKDGSWSIIGEKGGQTIQIDSRFIIDATGRAAAVNRSIGARTVDHELLTNTSAIYGHFQGLQDWTDVYRALGGNSDQHPFPAQRAALHHMINEGWMWQLGFDNGITSCGVVFAGTLPAGSVEDRWNSVLESYPSLLEQFKDSELAGSEELKGIKRIQYLREFEFVENLLSLPSTIGFVDPMHSTGIAQTLNAIEKIGVMFEMANPGFPGADDQTAYVRNVIRDVKWIDELVSAAYASRFDFELFVSAVLLYFVVVASAERDLPDSFLHSDTGSVTSTVVKLTCLIRDIEARHKTGELGRSEIRKATETIRKETAHLNDFGLMDPKSNNLYLHTAVDKSYKRIGAG